MAGRKVLSWILCVCLLAAMGTGFAGCVGDVQRDDEKTPQDSSADPGESENGENVSQAEHPPTEEASVLEENLSAPLFPDEKDREPVSLEWQPVSYEAKLPDYSVDPNLSNVINLEQFGGFTPRQKELLSRNGFVVVPSTEEQLFYIYERNEYLKLPSFITTDSVLQVYHVFFDYSLRTLEFEKLMKPLEQLTASMLQKSIALHSEVDNPDVKEALMRNTAYFGAAQLALQKPLPEGMPQEAERMAREEYTLISEEAGVQPSAIFPFKLDYSQYRPRGHYTRNEDFERYFRAMMWYGQAPFPLYVLRDGEAVQNIEGTLQALLMTYTVFMGDGEILDVELWEKIYDPTVFYVGKADDLTLHDYKDLLISVFGREPDIELFSQEEKMAQVYAEAEKLPEPDIQNEWLSKDIPTGKQFRFMGQRYIPDSEILQKLSVPIKRPVPTGLDVAGVLGSDRAYDLVSEFYQPQKNWPKYDEVFTILRQKFSSLPEETWKSNMYYGWLWVLRSLLEVPGEGYPSFMRSTAWQDKSLSTALGSWAELRHDTILYGKQSGAECGGGEIPPVIKSYVEPNVGMYQKLLWLTRYSEINLESKGVLSVELKTRMLAFEELLQFLTDCSVKELRNEELTEEEYYRLLVYGGTLESLTSSLAQELGMRWFEITSDTDKNMASIADVHTAGSSYLEEGVGTASQIFVVVPIGNELHLTRGAVFSYYEFLNGQRLTDEEWQKMLKEGTAPSQPGWTESFMAEPKEDIPVPPDPYSSGCE